MLNKARCKPINHWRLETHTLTVPIDEYRLLHHLHSTAQSHTPYALVIVDVMTTQIEPVTLARSIRMDPLCRNLRLLLLANIQNLSFTEPHCRCRVYVDRHRPTVLF